MSAWITPFLMLRSITLVHLSLVCSGEGKKFILFFPYLPEHSREWDIFRTKPSLHGELSLSLWSILGKAAAMPNFNFCGSETQPGLPSRAGAEQAVAFFMKMDAADEAYPSLEKG